MCCCTLGVERMQRHEMRLLLGSCAGQAFGFEMQARTLLEEKMLDEESSWDPLKVCLCFHLK